tara:strand:+ start:45 stop:434 length:390 start_codon:yes stop_codon:yes gene_type:complete
MAEEKQMPDGVGTIEDLVKHSLEQDYNKANEVFGTVMTTKLSDVLDQAKVKLAGQIYNGDPEDVDDPLEDEDFGEEDNESGDGDETADGENEESEGETQESDVEETEDEGDDEGDQSDEDEDEVEGAAV